MSLLAVLGPGGVGGFLAAALARSGQPVTVVAREPTAAAIADRGIEVESVRLGDFTAYPAAVAELHDAAEVLFVATKATGLSAALERIRAEPALVLPLLNGLDHLAFLRARFGPGRVGAGAIRIESDRRAAGRIVQTSPFLHVDLAADDGALRAALGPVASVLQNAGIPARLGGSEAQIMWTKLVRLNALACTTTATDRPIGYIRADPKLRDQLVACIAEASDVANAEGADIDPAQPLAELDEAHAELGSSMQRDIAAGREPELDAIAGAVLRAAARHELECPTIERFSAQIARRAGIPPPSSQAGPKRPTPEA